MKGKKKTRAADIKRRLIDDERDPSPFAGIRLVEKKEPEKKAKTSTVPIKPRKKPSEIVQGYDPSSSFADILYSFEHTGNPYSMPAPKGRRIEEKKTDFGAILDQWEGKGRKKTRPVSGETRKSVYNPTRSFGDILDSFEGRKPAGKESESAVPREEMPLPDKSGGLFRKKDEDDSVSPSVSWTIFGGRNESFTRQEPEAEIKEEGRPEESPAVRRSPEYSPSRSFSEILSEFEGSRKNAEKKEEKKISASGPKPSVPVPEDTLFRKPEEGESRAEGVSWSIFGGRNESFTRPEPESMVETQDLPPSNGERAHAPAYKGQKPFSMILNDYEKHDGEKTFEEYIKEKGDADEHKRSVFPISRLRTMPPQATLDLHGNTVKEAEDEVRRFLHECSENGLRKISIITGKGLHSEDGVGVLRQTVIRILDESGLVSERASAPLSAGGSGALWIILKA